MFTNLNTCTWFKLYVSRSKLNVTKLDNYLFRYVYFQMLNTHVNKHTYVYYSITSITYHKIYTKFGQCCQILEYRCKQTAGRIGLAKWVHKQQKVLGWWITNCTILKGEMFVPTVAEQLPYSQLLFQIYFIFNDGLVLQTLGV